MDALIGSIPELQKENNVWGGAQKPCAYYGDVRLRFRAVWVAYGKRAPSRKIGYPILFLKPQGIPYFVNCPSLYVCASTVGMPPTPQLKPSRFFDLTQDSFCSRNENDFARSKIAEFRSGIFGFRSRIRVGLSRSRKFPFCTRKERAICARV